MALLPIYRYFVFNGEVKPVTEFVPSENEGGIYEVVRVDEGVPLFLEDHLERFFISAEIAGKTIPFSVAQIEAFLKKLIDADNVNEGNILISCKTNLKAFFIRHQYPTPKQYQKGVICGILKAERENPNAKVFQTTVRQRANKMLEEFGFFEVLLEDHLGRITEGSRSNVFFVKGEQIITPPGNEVLLGITRQKTILLAQKCGLKVIEEEVASEGLSRFDGAFITGTSPKLLPIKQVEGVGFNPQNEIIATLVSAYDALIAGYKKEKRSGGI